MESTKKRLPRQSKDTNSTASDRERCGLNKGVHDVGAALVAAGAPVPGFERRAQDQR
jgi:hypothetical protein